MKKYLVDNIMLLSFYAIAAAWALSYNSILIDALFLPPLLFVMIVLHWRVLLLPLDIILGLKTRKMYYSGLFGTDALEFFPKKLIREFKFYYGKDELLVLLSLDESTLKENDFQHGDLVRITYYRFSRILKFIELVNM